MVMIVSLYKILYVGLGVTVGNSDFEMVKGWQSLRNITYLLSQLQPVQEQLPCPTEIDKKQ